LINRHRLVGALILLLSLAISPQSGRAATPRWPAAATTGTAILASGDLSLAADAAPAAAAYGDYARFGLFDSQPQITPATRRVLVQWSATVPAAAAARLDVRIAKGAQWSDWTLDVADGAVVTFDRVGQQVQYRLTLLAQASAPKVQSVSLSALPLRDEDVVRSSQDEPAAPTYHIRATRMGLVGDRTANGHIIQPNDWFVSLPSFRSLSSKGGSEYMARLSYNGKSVVVPVWEVGPWNIHDDYWNVDRERFADLPVGWPEDHAAYYDGYNGGRAEKGRVRFPTAADVGDGAWLALGIAMNDEQKAIDITFLWQGSDPGPNPTPQEPGAKPAPAPEPPADAAGVTTVDELSDGFARSDAKWYEFECGQGSHAFWTYTTTKAADATNSATWQASLPAGEYDVSVFVPLCRNGKTDTGSARYTIAHADGRAEIEINQAENAGNWVSLGTYRFDGGGSVALSDLAGDKMRAIWFDSARWTAK
jgi:hypothetical protein